MTAEDTKIKVVIPQTPVQADKDLCLEETPEEDESFYLSKIKKTITEMIQFTN